MADKSTLRPVLTAAAGVCALTFFGILAQALPPQGKVRTKDFGSSLKRLNPEQKKKAPAAGESKEKSREPLPEEDVVRVETSLVVCNFLIFDGQGRAVEGLTRDDFAVTEDGRPQEVGTFARGEQTTLPRSIVLIIDFSGSQLPYIETSVEAAKTLVDKLGPADRMALVTDEVKLLADFTRDKAELKKKLESLKKKAHGRDAGKGWFAGRSLQYSALMATLRELFGEDDLRPVVIFQTDGDEFYILRQKTYQHPLMTKVAREFSLADVYHAVERSRATIYSVIPGSPPAQLSSAGHRRHAAGAAETAALLDADTRPRPAALHLHGGQPEPESMGSVAERRPSPESALVELARRSGGWAAFLPEPARAEAVYSRILSDINGRYVIGYQPTNKERDGRRRVVNVVVRGHPEYVVVGRKSYYAPGPEN
ncbi:MAG TPA: VWA domain-containing protein [Pyrinomonadaceae bacterium]|nr:VWA domain-containing protein [Pyrinomonadaceae bacterium]